MKVILLLSNLVTPYSLIVGFSDSIGVKVFNQGSASFYFLSPFVVLSCCFVLLCLFFQIYLTSTIKMVAFCDLIRKVKR